MSELTILEKIVIGSIVTILFVALIIFSGDNSLEVGKTFGSSIAMFIAILFGYGFVSKLRKNKK
jgi:hypothetical protein